MAILIGLLGCFMLIIPSVVGQNQDSTPFDCRRSGQNCYSDEDVCNSTSGVCECGGSVSRDGPACNIITSQVNGTGCVNLDCGDGDCLSDGENTTCVCDPGFYGDACDIKYIFVECDRDGMKVFFNPYGDFGGRIFVKDKRNETTCHAEALPATPRIDIDDKYEGLYIDLKHNDSVCGVASPVEDDNITSISRTFVINYMTHILTGFDQLIHASCYFKHENHVVRAGNIIVENDFSVLEEEVVEDTFGPVSVKLTYGSNGPVVNLSEPILIDTEINVTIHLEQDRGAIKVNEIMFNSSDGPSDYEWIVFSAGCRDEGASAISFVDPEYADRDNDTIHFSFTTFSVIGYSSVSLWITVSICLDPADCALDVCSNSRRKREADRRVERDFEITFMIYQPSQNAEENGDGSPNDVSCTGALCSNKPFVIPLVAGFAGACVLLAFVAVLLCIVLRRRRAKQPKVLLK